MFSSLVPLIPLFLTLLPHPALSATQDQLDGTSLSINKNRSCTNLSLPPSLNATGTIRQPSLDPTRNTTWIWRTAIDTSSAGNPSQRFWLDTSESGDLYDAATPYDLCVNLFTARNAISYQDTRDDTGDCAKALGYKNHACFEKLMEPRSFARELVDKGLWGACAYAARFPDECGELVDVGDAGVRLEIPTDQASSTNSTTPTCPSTLNNFKADHSLLFDATLTSQSQSISQIDLYDRMANRTWILMVSARAKKNHTGEDPYYNGTRFVSLRNTDFVDGARKPKGEKGWAARGRSVDLGALGLGLGVALVMVLG